MNVEAAKSQIILAQHSLSLSSYHYGEEVSHMERAMQGGVAAVSELEAAAVGLVGYIGDTEEMLLTCETLEYQPGSVQYFVAKRAEAIEGGRDTISHLKSALGGIVQFSDSNDMACNEAYNARGRIDESEELLSGLGDIGSLAMLGKLTKAFVWAGEHTNSIDYAKDFIRNHHEDDPPDERFDIADLQHIIHALKEGVFLLNRTSILEPYVWTQEVKTASTKVSEEHIAYLGSLRVRVSGGVSASQDSITRCNEIQSIVRLVLQDSEGLLKKL